jgi:hypothetical protein
MNNNNNKNEKINTIKKYPQQKILTHVFHQYFPKLNGKWYILPNNKVAWIISAKIPAKYHQHFRILCDLPRGHNVFIPYNGPKVLKPLLMGEKVPEDGEEIVLYFSYNYPLTTLKEAILDKKINKQDHFTIIMKKIMRQYAALNKNYGFRMLDLNPENILISSNKEVYFANFLYSQTENVELPITNHAILFLKGQIYFTNKMNVRWNRSILNILPKINTSRSFFNIIVKNNISKINNSNIDIIRLLRIYNTSEQILFLKNYEVILNVGNLQFLNNNNIPIHEKIDYLLQNFDEIFLSY